MGAIFIYLLILFCCLNYALFYGLHFIISIYHCFSLLWVVSHIWVTTHQLRKAVLCPIYLDILSRRQITHFMNNTMITLLLVSVHKHTITRTSKKSKLSLSISSVQSMNVECDGLSLFPLTQSID